MDDQVSEELRDYEGFLRIQEEQRQEALVRLRSQAVLQAEWLRGVIEREQSDLAARRAYSSKIDWMINLIQYRYI